MAARLHNVRRSIRFNCEMEGGFDPIYLFPTFGTAMALLLLWPAMRSLRLNRLMADTPTCKSIAVFLGLVELKGTAEVEAPVIGTLSGERCVYYRWSAEERWSRTVTETYTDSKGNTRTRTRHESGWITVAHGGESVPFYLQDEAGIIRVISEGADIEPLTTFSMTCRPGDPLYYDKGPQSAIAASDHIRQFTEQAIPLHTPLYVMGTAREREDIVAAEIAHDPSSPLFLISTRTEDAIRRGKALSQWFLTVVACIVAVAGWLAPHYIRYEEASVPVGAGALAGFVLLWLICWIWTVYNSVARLNQRVSRAWSHVDIELKRRHDLIPQLVAAVTGFRDHEQSTQQHLAHLRSQLRSTALGADGSDPEAVAPDLIALREAYPQLKAGEQFLALQSQLTQTEQRIALARSYYNEIAGHFNTRIAVFPDRLIAGLGGFHQRPFMQAKGFERASVDVTFAQ